MRILIILLLIAIALMLPGCKQILMPNGIYRSNVTEDFIIVEGDKMSLNIKIDERSRDKTGEYAYKYTILPDSDGKIYLTLTSTEAAYGLGKYEYYWDGSSIKMQDKERKEEDKKIQVFKVQ